MFVHRESKDTPPAKQEDIPFVDTQLSRTNPGEEAKRRHSVLMECLDDERERQSEERIQAAIDEDFYDHLQWRQEDAAELIQRGQAPLVFNESRQSIDWIAGTEKRMRKDWKILGREKNDEKGADTYTQVVKQGDEANLTPWHHSRAFKQSAISGLSWLEEGINTEPGEEIIYSGSEDWRNVYRDSRDRGFDMKASRYLFRRKVTDIDYAIAILPHARDHLRSVSLDDRMEDENSPWYLGERLTGASDLGLDDGMPTGAWKDRRSYITSDYRDSGRRQQVELLECWYRVPESVDVFDDGPLDGQVFIQAMGNHVAEKRRGVPMFKAVRMRMRVMIATESRPLWDGPSPFAHNGFLLVPVWGYRRYRDGMCYGAMRGMRDLQEDVNKRASKALWLLSNNLMVADEGAVKDIEEARQEAARADGVIIKRPGKELRFEKRMAEVQGNLEMMTRSSEAMRNVGGVTNENLGRDTTAKSGIAIERKQDQGSLTTSELFDNLLLAKRMAGRLRLSHIKQFKTKQSIIRIAGEGAPVQFVTVNEPNPDTGEIMNDLAQINCDFIVSEQDYRESYVRAATEQMFELLGQIATYAPQVVMAVLDLAVEGSEVRNKDEWVSRIRKLNGQRDPTKEMTPEEVKAQQVQAAKQAEAEQVQEELIKAQLAELLAKVKTMDAERAAKTVEGLMAALQAAQMVVAQPAVTPVADLIAQEAGIVDGQGNANFPAGVQQQAAPVPTVPPGTPPADPAMQGQAFEPAAPALV